MEGMIIFREKLKLLYGRYDLYVRSALKFVVTLALLLLIGSFTGDSSLMGNPGVILILSLICMFMSKNVIFYVAAIYTALRIYPVSMEYCAVFVLAVLVIALLYMQFSPECAYLTGIGLLACILHISPVPAVLAGIFIGPAAIVPIVCGVFLYYILAYIPSYVDALGSSGMDSFIDRLRFIIENVFYNKTMFLAAAAAVLTILVVYILRRSKINHVWTIAAAVGLVLDFLIRLTGSFLIRTSDSLLSLFISLILSCLICFVVLFFTRSFDYKRVERVQFEDDNYYYYVKAIPKKHISGRQGQPGNARRKNYYEEGE